MSDAKTNITAKPLEVQQKDGFTLVQHKKKGRKNRRGKPTEINFDSFHHALDFKACDSSANKRELESREDVLRKIRLSTDSLKDSEFYSAFLQILTKGFEEVVKTPLNPTPKDFGILCFGLGAFTSNLLSRLARYQLSLLILLKEKFNSLVEIYDPIFSAQEKSILRQDFGFNVLEVNDTGKRRIERPTFVFMPHCPHQLVNNFLYANWDSEALVNCFLACNSISNTLCFLQPSYVDENLVFFREAQSVCTEISVPNTFFDSDVFNDTALHVFPVKKLENLPKEFWSDIACPDYTSKDFVPNCKSLK